MNPFERETVKREPIGVFKILMLILAIVSLTNLSIVAFRGLSPGLNSILTLAVLVAGVTLVWRLVAHNGESFTYKLVDDVLVVERTLGRSSGTFFSVGIDKVKEVRAYSHQSDHKIPRQRRFTISNHKERWRVVVYDERSGNRLILEPSRHFEQMLRASVLRDQVNV